MDIYEILYAAALIGIGAVCGFYLRLYQEDMRAAKRILREADDGN